MRWRFCRTSWDISAQNRTYLQYYCRILYICSVRFNLENLDEIVVLTCPKVKGKNINVVILAETSYIYVFILPWRRGISATIMKEEVSGEHPWRTITRDSTVALLYRGRPVLRKVIFRMVGSIVRHKKWKMGVRRTTAHTIIDKIMRTNYPHLLYHKKVRQ